MQRPWLARDWFVNPASRRWRQLVLPRLRLLADLIPYARAAAS
jgi:hypothetical protein